MRGHAVDCILSIVRCIQNRPRYFAEKLVKATEHTEKDHGTIIRIIVSRCEVDLGRIMEEFLDFNGKTIYKLIGIDYYINDSPCFVKLIIYQNLLDGVHNGCRRLLSKLIVR
ncbi:unnamed protein product [Schistosoma margrebowiei]|uniref:Annexin n=1 Tax=Schistosoma margrebowiei TaxID=48269 RepID=A0AA85AA29_9TREM|nr:unnamed protein product [Schistosoma margrebowiei]